MPDRWWLRLTPTRIRRVREALRMTQDAFGAALGYTGTAISYAERGARPVTRRMHAAIERLVYASYNSEAQVVFEEENNNEEA